MTLNWFLKIIEFLKVVNFHMRINTKYIFIKMCHSLFFFCLTNWVSCPLICQDHLPCTNGRHTWARFQSGLAATHTIYHSKNPVPGFGSLEHRKTCDKNTFDMKYFLVICKNMQDGNRKFLNKWPMTHRYELLLLITTVCGISTLFLPFSNCNC